jgi:iron complex outermembrane receptor protein
VRGGFRLDYEADEGTSLSLQGGLYDGEAGQTYSAITSPEPPFQEVFTSAAPFSGGHVLGRWQCVFSPQADLALQVYYDGQKIDEGIASDRRHTVDVDFQHRFAPGNRQALVWGLGYRLSRSKTVGTFTLSLDPSRRTEDLFSAFVQDDVKVAGGHGLLTVGAKVEHHSYVGFEVQPNVRFLWRLDERQRIWGAVARALRTPAGAETRTQGVQLVVPTGDLVEGYAVGLVTTFPNPKFKSEEVIAYEAGYRFQWTQNATIDLAGFYNIYDRLRTFEPFLLPYVEAEPTPHLIIPLRAGNKMDGKVYGFELEAQLRPISRWRLRSTYALLRMELELEQNSQDLFSAAAEEEVPEHQLALQSTMDLGWDVQFDVLGRYVGRLPGLRVDGYYEVDARLAWKPLPDWEIAVVGQNLLDDHHSEFKPVFLNSLPTEVQRGVYGAVTWSY